MPLELFKTLKNKFFHYLKSNLEVPLTDPKTFYSTLDTYFSGKSNKNQVSWIFDCIDVWGKHFAKVKFRLYENRNGEDEEIVRHPIVNMFTRPNIWQTWWEAKYRLAQHFGLYGNGYFFKVRNSLGLPSSLIQLLPSSVTPNPSSEGGIKSFQYVTGKSMIELPAEDVIHFRYPDPDNLLIGKSIISNIANESEINQLQSEYQKQFYKQGGFMGQIFTTDQVMSQQVFERTQNTLREKYSGGVTKSYQLALLDSGLTPVTSPYSIKDMDVKSLKDLNRDEICAAFQVNKFMLGMAENINRATAQEVSLQFASGVIEPLMDYADNVFTNDLAMEFGKSLFIKHDNTSPRDQDGELGWYESGLQNGWLTPNEVRQYEGLDMMNLDYMNVPIDLTKTKTKTTKETVN